MDPIEEFTARIHHSCREGYYNSMKQSAEEALRKYPDDTRFKFYFAISLVFNKKHTEALRELQPLQNEAPVALGSSIAAVVSHKACVNIDKEELVTCETRIKEGRKSGDPEAFYYAGLFQALYEKPDKAKEYIDRLLKNSPDHGPALSLRGWIEMKLPAKDKGQKEPKEYFNKALKLNRKNVDSILGLAQYCEISHEFDLGLEKLNELIAYHPNWWPALIGKMKLSLCLQDWDQALDLANRIANSVDNLEAQRVKILYSLCREGDLKHVAKALDIYFNSCKRHEPYNAKFFIENARMFSQLASYDQEILNQSMKFARYATENDMDYSEYTADVGKILLLMGKVKAAFQEFKLATSMDPSSIPALFGLISCQLAEGEIEMAFQQLDFLKELAADVNAPSELAFLTAKVSKKKNQSPQIILKYLNEAVDSHYRQMKGLPFNIAYLKQINPDLVVRIVREFLNFAPQEPVSQGMLPSLAVRQAVMILEPVIKVCPKHKEALFINAQTKYLSGDFRISAGILNEILQMDSSSLDACLLLTEVYLALDDYKLAEQILENALSSNFKVRENPKYNLLAARVQKQKGDMEKALKTLEAGLDLVKKLKSSKSGQQVVVEIQESFGDFGLSDKMTLYMELSTTYSHLGKEQEASRVMEEALEEFKGTHLEGRISLTQAEDLMEKDQMDQALNLLRVVSPDQTHYVEAKKLMSNIFLNHQKDNKLYISCYLDIVEQNSSPQNLLLLGDAYMTIQEPDLAIEKYEAALAKNPRDPNLQMKMGQALVKTHLFKKAINYYKEAIKTSDNFTLRFDLASLLVRLSYWDKAEKNITQALQDLKDSSLDGLSNEVKLLILLSKAQEGGGNIILAQQSLIKAKDTQNRVVKRATLEQPSSVDEQKIEFVKICQLIGELPLEKASELEYAIKYIKEALELCPDDVYSLAILSKLYMKNGDHIHCQQICQKLLALNKDSVEAASMLGELFFRKCDFATASIHFQQFLDKNPTHWESLKYFIDCSRCAGQLTEVPPYIKNAEEQCDPNDPGYGFCKGLYEWYNGDPNGALKQLNKARKDPNHGQRTIYLMIDIYLNPSGAILGSEALDTSLDTSAGGGKESGGGGDMVESKELALKTAETLLWELQIKTGDEKFRRQVLECLILLASKNKNRMEKAVQELCGLVTTDSGRDSVMLCYALSTGYILVKQTPRARNHLKRMQKANWTLEDAEYLEKCWLLLADVYIQSSKFDLATDLIKKVILYNKSCSKASEYLGFIMEKEQAFADAAVNYEHAWKMGNCSNPTLGYKLAFNYLKAKRYTDAIDVCHSVLKKNPSYPRIKKDILDKARSSLRT